MKKFSVLFLAGLLILAFGATVYAQAPKLEFKASGFIDTQTFIGRNVPEYQTMGGGFYKATDPGFTTVGGQGPGGPGWNKVDSHWEARAHLKFDAIMGPNLSGTIYFEIDTFRWGAPYNGYPGGGNNSALVFAQGREANNFGAYTTDRAAVEVKNIYIDVGLPYFGVPVPITVRIGAQTMGVRPAMFWTDDATGITAGIKIDPVMIIPIYAKALENSDYADDDADIWGLHVNAKIGTFTVGGYGMYWRMNSYPFYVAQPSTASNPAGTLTAYSPGSDKAHMWWVGAYADGKAGPVNLNFDAVFDFGNVKKSPDYTAARPPDVTYKGWAVRGKVDYPWEKFAFGGVGMYASGANANKTSTSGLPGSASANGTISRDMSGWVTPPASEAANANQESVVVYSMEPGATGGYGLAQRNNYGQMTPGAFGGTWFAKLYGTVKAQPWWKITFWGLYIGDTVKNGDAVGSSYKYQGPTATTLLKDHHEIGWELDLINEFQIYPNLRFWVGAGYLFAGGATDVGQRVSGVNVNHSIANPWALRTRLQYTF